MRPCSGNACHRTKLRQRASVEGFREHFRMPSLLRLAHVACTAGREQSVGTLEVDDKHVQVDYYIHIATLTTGDCSELSGVGILVEVYGVGNLVDGLIDGVAHGARALLACLDRCVLPGRWTCAWLGLVITQGTCA